MIARGGWPTGPDPAPPCRFPFGVFLAISRGVRPPRWLPELHPRVGWALRGVRVHLKSTPSRLRVGGLRIACIVFLWADSGPVRWHGCQPCEHRPAGRPAQGRALPRIGADAGATGQSNTDGSGNHAGTPRGTPLTWAASRRLERRRGRLHGLEHQDFRSPGSTAKTATVLTTASLEQ